MKKYKYFERLESRSYFTDRTTFFTQVLQPCSLVMENMMHVSGLQTVVLTVEELTIKVSWIIKAVFGKRSLFSQGSYCLDFFNLYIPLLNISFQNSTIVRNRHFYFLELLCVGQVVTCLLFWLFLGNTQQT